MIKAILATVAAIGIFGIMAFAPRADAGDVKIVRRSVAAKELVTFLQERTDKDNGHLIGPFDIIVENTDKGANAFKYSNVPFVFLITDNIIAFPNGDLGKKNKPIFIFTSNFTIRSK